MVYGNFMDRQDTEGINPGTDTSRSGCLRTLKIIAVFFLIIILFSAWWVKHNIYASKFSLTQLDTREQKVLDAKLDILGRSGQAGGFVPEDRPYDPNGPLIPEPYTEEGAGRTISLTEKELNSLVANSPDVARRVAIDLSDNLVSIKIVVPMEEDVPVLGGKTLRLNMGVILSYDNEQPVVALKGISLGGIPLPNAWLGNVKNINLIHEFGADGGFWELFSEGVQDLNVVEGRIRITLKE
jgi:hypothetical protein